MFKAVASLFHTVKRLWKFARDYDVAFGSSSDGFLCIQWKLFTGDSNFKSLNLAAVFIIRSVHLLPFICFLITISGNYWCQEHCEEVGISSCSDSFICCPDQRCHVINAGVTSAATSGPCSKIKINLVLLLVIFIIVNTICYWQNIASEFPLVFIFNLGYKSRFHLVFTFLLLENSWLISSQILALANFFILYIIFI